ncbi:MAG: flagella basal body P-ring formation protein FlgA [Capsulimonadaceae bacterium]|nr:flagella basal body P-ring formation protein FlgA [Capsulimonadaceae bacterium]
MRVLIAILILMSTVLAHAATAPLVTLKSSATVSGPAFTLADIATVQGAADETVRLGTAQMGRSPMCGATRSITRADVGLKLRQAGIDPATINFAGSETVLINLQAAPIGQSSATTAKSMVPVSGSSAGEAPAASNFAATAPANPVGMKAGDPVTVLYEDGPVRITVTGSLTNSANIGDKVSVSTPISPRLLKGTLVDLGTVRI